jgi:hypothetical protein
MELYNVYNDFIENGVISLVPPLVIPVSQSDKYRVWRRGDAMDAIASEYYDNPIMARVIIGANLEYGLNETEYPDGVVVRIPYPKQRALQLYYEKVQQYLNRNRR